jgi:hypothetical protein
VSGPTAKRTGPAPSGRFLGHALIPARAVRGSLSGAGEDSMGGASYLNVMPAAEVSTETRRGRPAERENSGRPFTTKSPSFVQGLGTNPSNERRPCQRWSSRIPWYMGRARCLLAVGGNQPAARPAPSRSSPGMAATSSLRGFVHRPASLRP